MKVEEIKEHLKNLSIEELHNIKSIIRDTIENKKSWRYSYKRNI